MPLSVKPGHESFGELGEIYGLGLEVSLRHSESVTHPKNRANPIDP